MNAQSSPNLQSANFPYIRSLKTPADTLSNIWSEECGDEKSSTVHANSVDDEEEHGFDFLGD